MLFVPIISAVFRSYLSLLVFDGITTHCGKKLFTSDVSSCVITGNRVWFSCGLPYFYFDVHIYSPLVIFKR
jgi:hypothetical protein